MKLTKTVSYLACPQCFYQKLLVKEKKLICPKCQKKFDVVKGIPILFGKDALSPQEKTQREYFDKHYKRQKSKKLENWHLSMIKKVFNPRFTKRAGTYLDVGCGATGYTVTESARRGRLSFGVDLSLEAVIKAKKRAEKGGFSKKTAFILCSAENLPFKKNLFSYVSCLSLLEHLENDQQALREIARVTKKDSHLYICVPNTYRRILPFLRPIYYYFDKKFGHKRHYGIEDLNKMAKRVGFLPKKVFYNGHLVKIYQLLAEKVGLISKKDWWKLEERDISQDPSGLQLNAIYKKIR